MKVWVLRPIKVGTQIIREGWVDLEDADAAEMLNIGAVASVEEDAAAEDLEGSAASLAKINAAADEAGAVEKAEQEHLALVEAISKLGDDQWRKDTGDLKAAGMRVLTTILGYEPTTEALGLATAAVKAAKAAHAPES